MSSAVSGSELARLWREAPAALAHASGCSCCGGAPVGIDPAAVEADILDYLALKYRAAGVPALAAFVAARQLQPAGAFGGWLARLDQAPLPASAIEVLQSDLAATLRSIGGQG